MLKKIYDQKLTMCRTILYICLVTMVQTSMTQEQNTSPETVLQNKINNLTALKNKYEEFKTTLTNGYIADEKFSQVSLVGADSNKKLIFYLKNKITYNNTAEAKTAQDTIDKIQEKINELTTIKTIFEK